MISIITGLRTGVQFLPECAASIAAQTYQDWEWLIGVNGFCAGSPVYQYARAFSDNLRVHVYDLAGCKTRPRASQCLVGAAQGDLIAIHDVDDRWHPEKLEKQLAFIGELRDCGRQIGVCATRGRYFGDSVNGQQNVEVPVKTGRLTYEDVLETNHIIHSSVLMRREHCRWPDTDLLDDYPLWLDLLKEGVSVYVLDEELVRCRVHPDQYYAGARDNSEAIRKERAQCP